jgi:hypothetical protein
MPCYRCGVRQVDPDRGASPWLRGVRADRQVLICPDCQVDGTWVTDLDRCALCASVRLVRRLGEVECRDCGALGSEAVGGSATGDIAIGMADALLAEEVEQALARVLRRRPSTDRPTTAGSAGIGGLGGR